MTSLVRALVAALVVTLPVLAGCGAEEVEGREVAYPEPIGYTPPAEAAASQDPGAVQAFPAGEPVGPTQVSASADQEVVIGDDDAPAAPAASGDEYSDTDPSALTDFRSALDPYGTWSEDPTYGTVWQPSASVVGSDFTPYQTAGHWVYDDDYTWVSDYDWGWAPFHYGRWVSTPGGWEWIPGRSYAGAWVSWRYGWDGWGYVGWAPLAPAWGWRRGVAVGYGFVPRAPYTFVGSGHLFAPNVGAHAVVGAQVGVVASHTRPWIAATPSVGGHVAARPGVGGPPPSVVQIQASGVAHAQVDRGLAQARAFSRPSTAVALGARSPQRAFEGAPARASTNGEWSHAVASPGRTSPPAYGPPAPSHFGGRLGGGFAGSASSAPAYSAPTRSPAFSGSSRPSFSSPAPRSAPVFRSPSAGFSGGGAAAPRATFRSSAPSSFHSSAPSGGGFRGGGGGGGSRGGGRGGHR